MVKTILDKEKLMIIKKSLLLKNIFFSSFFLFLAVLSIFFNKSAFAADLDELIQNIQNQYKKSETVSGNFTQILVHKESGVKTTRQGSLFFQKPLLIRWETTGKSKELLLVNKSDVWNYLIDEEVAYRYPLGIVKDSQTFIRIVAGQANLKDDFEVSKIKEEDGLIVLQLYPVAPSQELTEAIIWVDPAIAIIKRAKIFDFFYNQNEIIFDKIDLNKKIDSALFDFTPPNGVEVEDRREVKVQEKMLFQ